MAPNTPDAKLTADAASQPPPPTPKMPSWTITEDIVITGISGRFAESDNMQELRDHLMNNDDLVTEDSRRWPPGLMGMPRRAGKIKDLSKFDATFFGIHGKQTERMDPQLRLMLEVTYEAIADAGYNPADLKGKNIGVFVGTSNSDYFEGLDHLPECGNAFAMTGCNRGMFANRVSFHYDFQGPSMALDTACSSSLFAFDDAILNLRNNRCDAAIVGGLHVCMRPAMTQGFNKLGMLSKDGKCRSFDEDASGYVRSEAVVAVFLQKSSIARRVYATVLHSKSNSDGYKDQGITYPKAEVQKQLLIESYAEAGINPKDVAYLEAHGTGTSVGDPEELGAIADFFCKDRNQPLLVGSVKSSYGHSEAASGLCSIAKLVIAMEEGVIPANINFNRPNPNIPSLFDNRVKVVTENTPWYGGIAGVNNFGFGGVNSHVILRSHPYPKIPRLLAPKEGPKLFIQAGRTEENLADIINLMEKESEDRDLYTLLSHLANAPLKTHTIRGYSVLNSDPPIREIKRTPEDKKPIWYVMTGMGCQWRGMARDLMQLTVFRDTLIRANDILKPYNINLLNLLMSEDDRTWDTIVHPFVALISIQVALVNTLRSIGIEPDGIVGHSVGELSCAYADGCFTEEQAILAAYWRGRLSVDEPNLPVGLMASIGLTWEETEQRLPKNIYLACNNAEDNVTISGVRTDVVQFLDQIKEEGVFARTVNTGNLSYHCKYIDPVAPKLLEAVKKLVPNPKPRTKRWISSSIRESEWGSPLAATSSAEYHVNNLVSPVLFQNAMTKVPKDAIVIEVGAHCLLQAIVKRNLGSDITYIGLQKRNENGLNHFLTQIGKFYLSGHDPAVHNLWDPVPLPVPRGTRMISPLIGWDHSQQYEIIPFQTIMGCGGVQQIIEVSIESDESPDYYITDHAVDGRVLYPMTGYVVLAWKAFARTKGLAFNQVPVVFENLAFHRATILSKSGPTKLSIGLMDVGGYFEISEGGAVVASGRVYEPENPALQYRDIIRLPTEPSKHLKLTSKDLYKDLRLRGYEYGPTFQGVIESDNEGHSGKLRWDGNWVTFMDTLLQFNVIRRATRGLFLPTGLEYLRINPLIQPPIPDSWEEGIPVYCDHVIDVVTSGGVETKGLKASVTNRRPPPQAAPILERHSFIPFNEQKLEDLHSTDVLKSCLDIVHENVNSPKIKMVEVGAAAGNLFTRVVPIVNSQLLTQADCTASDANASNVNADEASNWNVRVTKWDFISEPAPQSINDSHLVFGHNILGSSNEDLATVLQKLSKPLRDGGFLLLSEPTENKSFHKAFQSASLELVSEKTSENHTSLFLLRKVNSENNKASVILIEEGQFNKWVEPIKKQLQNIVESQSNDETLWLIAHDKYDNGILGLINCLHQEPGGNKIRAIFNPNLEPSKAKQFQSDPVKALKAVYPEFVKKDLFVSVNKDGVWGTYRHLPLNYDIKNERVEAEESYVQILTRGDLTSLKWIESPIRKIYGDTQKHIAKIYYSSLNFTDIMLASGKIAPEAKADDWAVKDFLGSEFCGRDENGRRIMGALRSLGLATSTVYDPVLKWEIPDHWSMEDAATVPIVYSTVYYALVIRADIKRKDSILIHSGTGGIGQAAIAVAFSYDCDIYTTVGSKAKKETLLKLYPKLNPDHIFHSRDITFENNLMKATNGRGVDIVLNSLSEEKQMASVRCLARNGRFVDIGKFDMLNNAKLGMGVFLKNASFHGVFADFLLEKDHPDRQWLSELLVKGIKDGVVKPLTRHVFNRDQVEDAFRFMASGKHIGKVIIKVADEEPEKVVPKPKKELIKSVLRTAFVSRKSYIITGGLGGFGLETAFWLVDRGARNLVLSSRTGIRDGYQERCVRIWRKNGVNVTVSTHDITTLDGATKLIEDANKLGPCGGIFNLAMVLRDAFMENQTVDNYLAVSDPKVKGTRNLDVVSRKLCPELDWFVAFSSLSCGRGNAGQSNYGYSNSIMERLCEQRQRDGFHGLAIQWGGIGDVGWVIETLGADNTTAIGGTLPQTINSCNSALDVFLNQKHPVVASYVFAEKEDVKLDTGKKMNLLDSIGHILGVKDLRKLNANLTLAELGMDSIMGVEIKQTLERHFDLVLTMTNIRRMDIKTLQQIDSGEQPSETPEVPAEQPAETKPSAVEDIKGVIEEDFDIQRYDFDHIIPTECIVPLNSVTEGLPVFIVHPVEGSLFVLESLASKLRCPVYGIQITADAPLTNMKDLAAFYIKQIKAKQPNGPYRLAGYSFGGANMFEIVTQLQASGNPTDTFENIIFLDGSQKYVTNYVDDEYLRKLENNELHGQDEADALILFAVQFTHVDYNKFKAVLMALPNWEKRLQATTDLLLKSSQFKTEADIKFAASVFCRLGTMCLLYNPTAKINADVVLIKATTPGLAKKWGDDYGLSKAVNGNIERYPVPGTHHSFIHGDNATNVANIINRVFKV